jgi:hypothetical protein
VDGVVNNRALNMKTYILFCIAILGYSSVRGQSIAIVSPKANETVKADTEYNIVFNVQNDNFGSPSPRFKAFICSDFNNPNTFDYLGYSETQGTIKVKIPPGYNGNFWITVQANSPTSSKFPFSDIVVLTQFIQVNVIPNK